jgi:hypothetical protein
VVYRISLIALLLTACGSEEAQIAKSVRFSIDFEREEIEMTFDLHPDYVVPLKAEADFDALGEVRLEQDAESQMNIVLTNLNAQPTVLSSE